MQNNGVLAVTRCVNRTAGCFCCVFLILFGVLGKISGAFLASKRFSSYNATFTFYHSPYSLLFPVPNSVLGGMTTFLFASVMASGLRVLAYVRWTRRDRFIVTAALSFGAGDLIVPTSFTHLFDGVHSNAGVHSLLDSITIVLDTPCESLAKPRLLHASC